MAVRKEDVKAYVGQRIQGAALAERSNRQVSFDKSASVMVPPGGSVTSDPVSMSVRAQQDLAVSLYIPEAHVRPSQHGGAQVTSYVTAKGSGDLAAGETAKGFTGTTTSMFSLKAIVDAHDHWEDLGRGLKIVGVTIIPRHNRPPAGNNSGWNAAKTQVFN